MRVFVTGSTGFIGSAVVADLVGAGHHVIGLARSDQGAAALRAQRAEPLPGTLDDLDVLRDAAAHADAVVHLAFNHDWSKFAANVAQEQRALEAITAALDGQLLAIASGVLMAAPGRLATEDDETNPSVSPRLGSHTIAKRYAERGGGGGGGKAAFLRFSPTVHGAGDHGFMAMLVNIARDKGVAGYLGDGANRWPAVHRLDAAHLVRLVVEQGAGGAIHAVGEEGIPLKDIAALIGAKLGLPVAPIPPADAAAHFGFLASFLALDSPASSAKTRARLGWEPTHPGLLADMASTYF